MENIEVKRNAKKRKIIIPICIAFFVILLVVITLQIVIPSSNYKKGIALYNEKSYEAAVSVFESLNGYKDSDNQIKKCNDAIKERDYKKAIALYKDGKYEKAIEAFKKLKGYKDSDNQVKKCNDAIKERDYKKAIALCKDGKYEKAIEVFKKLKGYKDSDSQINVCNKKILHHAKVGDTVYFGMYFQSDLNKREPVGWRVLEKTNESILVISEYILECLPFGTALKLDAISWEESDIREFLNDTFMDVAFTKYEKEQIKTVTLSNSDGHNTIDKIFLLSTEEAEKYFSSDESRKAIRTKNAIERIPCPDGYVVDDNGEPHRWWLRSTGETFSYNTSFIYGTGELSKFRAWPSEYYGVRPAFWISI